MQCLWIVHLRQGREALHTGSEDGDLLALSLAAEAAGQRGTGLRHGRGGEEHSRLMGRGTNSWRGISGSSTGAGFERGDEAVPVPVNRLDHTLGGAIVVHRLAGLNDATGDSGLGLELS